jgi:biopolymer transport protein ExbD
MAMMAGQKAQIDITPMIDILLVLIVIFMVITPLKQGGLWTILPQPAPPGSQPERPASAIVLTVLTDGTVRLNQEPVDRAHLGTRLAGLFRAAPDHVIFVRGEKGIEFRPVAEVIDIANGAGLNRVALMTE